MPQGQPFLKWVGGKRELLPDLLRYVPNHVKTYYEPFLGGGALFWKLASDRRFERANVSDLNGELINLYQVIRNNPVAFLERMDALAKVYLEAGAPSATILNPEAAARALFEHVRAEQPVDDLGRAVRFLFLNKTCFNGLHRTNKSGGFNSSWGKEVNVSFYSLENIVACAELLQNVEIRHDDYSMVDDKAKPGDFVYFDPPYFPVSKTAAFASYLADGFDEEDQKILSGIFRLLSDRGVHVMLSNSDVPEIRELYEGFEIKIIRARRSVNSKGDARGPVNEVLVLGKGVTAAEDPFDLLASLDQEF